jgi:hypothetical protein
MGVWVCMTKTKVTQSGLKQTKIDHLTSWLQMDMKCYNLTFCSPRLYPKVPVHNHC